MISRLPAVLAVAYPLLAHAAAWTASAGLALVAGFLLALLLCAAGLLWLHGRALGTLPLLAPPVLLNAFLAWLFARTLRAGRRPLIEHMVWTLHGEPDALDPRIAPYARRLTAV